MTDAGKEKPEEVRDDATDSRTLDEIEADEKVPDSEPESSVPSPDEGGGRDRDSDLDGVE
jgi:hypothetical protein